VASLALGAGAAAHAQKIYRCDGPGGVVEYSNSPVAATGRNCRAIEIAPITTIPAPAPRAPATPAPGAGAAASEAKPAAASAAHGATQASRGAESFPRVSASAQKERDNDRRRILEDELRKEQERLANLQGEYKNGEPDRLGNERNYQKYLDRVQQLKQDIERTEGNLATIRRELAAIKD
jgi:hypothetical protein